MKNNWYRNLKFIFISSVSKTKVQIVILILSTLITYINILQNDFAYDDKYFLVDWPTIQELENIPLLIGGDLPYNHRGVYRPVRGIFYAISYQLWRDHAIGYHFQAIIIHLINTLLVYLISVRLYNKKLFAFIVSLIFSIHPIHTEAVTFTAASFDTIGIIFFLLSFYLFLKYQTSYFENLKIYIGSLIFAVLAYFTYEMTLILPLIIGFYCFIYQKSKLNNLITKFKISLPYILLSLLYPLIRFGIYDIRERSQYIGLGAVSAANTARVEILEIIWKYISLLLYPHNLTVKHPIPTTIIDYLFSIRKGDLSFYIDRFLSLDPLFPFIVIGLSIVIFLKLFNKIPILCFGFVWFMISLLPVSSLTPQGAVIAERFLYISSVGFCFVMGYIIYILLIKTSQSKYGYIKFLYKLIVILFISLIIFYSNQTIFRNGEWKNNVILWEKTQALNPNNPSLTETLALVYQQENMHKEAIGVYQSLIQSNPKYMSSYIGLAESFQALGSSDDAKAICLQALAIDNKFVNAYSFLAGLEVDIKNYDQAISYYQKALEINPNDPYNNYHLALTYEYSNQINKAIEFYEKTTSLLEYPIAYRKLGSLYLQIGNSNLAQKAFTKAKQIETDIN